jgi:hypothetical protein
MAQGKSPFELRADLLKLAYDILLSQKIAEAVAQGKDRADAAPTSDEVIAEARKLNEFISRSGDRREK